MEPIDENPLASQNGEPSTKGRVRTKYTILRRLTSRKGISLLAAMIPAAALLIGAYMNNATEVERVKVATAPDVRFTYQMLPVPDELLRSDRSLLGIDASWSIVAMTETGSYSRAIREDLSGALESVTCSTQECVKALTGFTDTLALRTLYVTIENTGQSTANNVHLTVSYRPSNRSETGSFAEILNSTLDDPSDSYALGEIAHGEVALVPLVNLIVFNPEVSPYTFVSAGRVYTPLGIDFEYAGAKGTIEMDIRDALDVQILDAPGGDGEARGT